MITGTYRLAGQNIEITSIYRYVHTLCSDYQVSAPYDFSVRTEQSDIDYERDKTSEADSEKSIPPRKNSGNRDAYLETLAVYRKIAEEMPKYDTFLFHASAIAVDGRAYIFTAKSGTGKSTHARLWRELLGDRAVMINDDKPLIRIQSDGTAVVYGTPWNGKHHLDSNISVPLKAVCILRQNAENSIRTLSPGEALPVLLQQTYRPADRLAMSRTLMLVDRFSRNVKMYFLECNMNPDAARLSYGAMSRD